MYNSQECTLMKMFLDKKNSQVKLFLDKAVTRNHTWYNICSYPNKWVELPSGISGSAKQEEKESNKLL